MTSNRNLFSGRTSVLAIAPLLGMLLLGGCGGSDAVSPSVDAPEASAPADSAATVPTDSTIALPDTTLPPDSTATADSTAIDSTTMEPVIISTGSHSGIAFGAFNMRSAQLTPVLHSTMQGVWPDFLMGDLVVAKAKGGRMILKTHGGSDDLVKNADGTFSLSKWKALAYRYKKYNFNSYITDGTLMGHFLIDEPENTAKWGGKTIPYATIEAMAKYSKELWPNLATFARTKPSWLAKATFNWVYLDAGWVQYLSRLGDASSFIAAEVAAAKSKGLGVMTGMNILDGGNGSSGVPGYMRGKWAMSDTEIRNYGTALLNQSYVCGFVSWTYLYMGATYFAKPAINAALAELSTKAKGHLKTSCRQ